MIGLGRLLPGMYAALTLLASGLTPPLFAQMSESLAERAESLRKEARWREAAELYAELTRREPSVPDWSRKLRHCRIQDQIANRYHDPAFQRGLLQVSFETAINIYAEVIGKIQTHYVEEVEVGRLFAQGIERLELALHNPDFLRTAFAVPPNGETLNRARSLMPSRIPETVSRRDAQIKVQALAITLQQETGVNPTAVVLEFAFAAAEALDDYSAFLSPERLALEKILAEPDVAGIGIELQYGGGVMHVAGLVPNGPAARAGIQLHDRVFRIDDVDVRRLSVEEATLRLLGRENTRVTLDVMGVLDWIPRPVVVVRERFSLPSLTTARLVDVENGIGYVHLGFFQTSTADELDTALDRLMLEGMRVLILDLRGNPGGSFEAALQVADRFIVSGVLAATRGRSPGTTQTYRTQDDRAVVVPLVVLIDADTASAAEIVAAALRDHQRAKLVGQPTAGKGTIQYVYPLRTASCGLRLTAARYLSPLLIALDGQPIQPDVPVDGSTPLSMNDDMLGMVSVMQLQQRQFETALQIARQLAGKPGM